MTISVNPAECPIPNARSWSEPEGTGANRVLILGEALGDQEARDHLPFRPHDWAGAVLDRAIRRCGFSRESFVIWNVVPVQPPNNYLEGAPYEAAAVAWGLPFIREVIREYKPACILALGNIPLRAASGLAGERLSVGSLRGYCIPGVLDGVPVVASFHPSFLRRANMGLMSVLMHDIKLAVAVAATEPGESTRFFSPVLWRDFEFTHPVPRPLSEPVVPSGYLCHPTEGQAKEWLEEAKDAKLITYDIETPRSTATDELDTDELADKEILSVQFSSRPRSGIFLPFREPFIDIVKQTLELHSEKAGANTWRFDDPLLEAHGCRINGIRHDVRWAFHHLQPDLRGALQFIASFYANEVGPWKHLHESHPEVYGIRDVDVIQYIMGEA